VLVLILFSGRAGDIVLVLILSSGRVGDVGGTARVLVLDQDL
jgi:hypothetical protein